MNRKSHLASATLALCGGVSAMAAAGTADAADAARVFAQNGGSACTGALPTYEGALRKRPKAIANEGTSTAFVTCSALADYQNPNKPNEAMVFATNRSAAPVTLSCTLVLGDDYYGSVARTGAITLPVNALTQLRWLPLPGEATLSKYSVNVSCALPPGVELNFFAQRVNENVGN